MKENDAILQMEYSGYCSHNLPRYSVIYVGLQSAVPTYVLVRYVTS